MWSNCALFAWRQQRQFGGYVVTRRSKYGWWSHYFWTADFVTFWAYETTIQWLKDLYRTHHWFVPPLLFPGEMVRHTVETLDEW